MDDRYEIRGKIAQGGLGSVYKAHDVRMSRDVAIKRILTNFGDTSITDEATRQLIKEASALASLQHPNIVTIYDVGKDAEGPFVVMEFLTGQTLEEIITHASFTWDDFRQLAMQSLEALIAAQELHIVHRDIKPGNIMLTWLPSGKFQVKVVDFGLAKLSTKPSLQTIDQSDGVFGSIYFMGPEQFERIPIDQRVDLYALGSVFYYALTGTYAFDGENAVEVMASHLQHHVVPIQEVRAGIPLWACNWIMWLINRQPSDRPSSAREALEVFMQNDSAYISPEMSTGEPTPIVPVETVKRPKLFIPGAALEPVVVEEPKPGYPPKKTASLPRPLSPPQGSKPSVHNTTRAYQTPETSAPQPEPEPIAPAPAPVPPLYQPTPPQIQASTLSPPALSIPAVQSITPPAQIQAPSLATAVPTAAITRANIPVGSPTQKANATKPLIEEEIPTEQPFQSQKKPIPTSIKVVVSIVLLILITFLSLYLIDRSKQNAEIALYNEMIVLAAKENTTEVPVNKNKLSILLRNASTPGGQEDRSVIYRALILAKAIDKKDVDKEIFDYSTSQDMHGDIRIVLLKEVLGSRKNPKIVNDLIKYSKSAPEPRIALASIEACREMATEAHFDNHLDLLKNTTDEAIRKAAEDNLAAIISKSNSLTLFRNALVTTYKSASLANVKHATLRLLGRVGGDQALAIVKENLNSPDHKTKVVALGALGSWVDRAGFNLLINQVATEPDVTNRKLAYEAAIKCASTTKDKPEEAWKKIAELTTTQEDQIKLINSLASYSADTWVFDIINNIIKTSTHPTAVDRAKKAVIHLENMKKAQGGSTKIEK
ncbi:MAG: protein kinase domain-containing protein [Akkermansiaceae bacterium]|jgi:serine/threonine protein kinase|nr:protein kinase [Luteolibacter sp.]